MAELIMRVKAEYDSAVACREELKKVEEELKKVNENTSPKEISRLTQRYAELSAKWENGLSNISKMGYYAKDIFVKIGNAVRGVSKEVQSGETANNNLYSTLVKRLAIEEKISEVTTRQKANAEDLLEKAKEGYNRNAETFDKLKKILYDKNDGKGEGFWSDEDQKQMERGRESLRNWENEINNRQTQVNVLSDILEQSGKRLEDYKKKLSDFDLPQLDLKSNIEDLSAQVKSGGEQIDLLKGKLASLNEELKERNDFQGAKEKMSGYFDDLEEKKKEIEELQQIAESFSLSNLVNEQQRLEDNATAASEKLKAEEDAIARLSELQSGLNINSAAFATIQSEIDYHTEERDKYAKSLEDTNKSISETKTLIDDEVKAQSERQQKIKELSSNIDDLTAKYEYQKEIVNNTEANKEAISRVKQEIADTKEQIDQTTDSTKALKDVLEQVNSTYEKNKQNQDNVYKGYVGSEYKMSSRVYTNEGDFREAGNLAEEINRLQNDIDNFKVVEGKNSVEELKALQDELTETQAKFDALDSKARDTATALGGELAQKAENLSVRLFTANKNVEDAERKYAQLNKQLEDEKRLLEAIEENSTDQKTITEAKNKVDELTESLNKQKETIAELKAEQKDAQDAVDKTNGELGDTLKELKSGKGVLKDFEQATSMLPEPLQKVVGGVKGVGNAMKILAKNPLMIALGALVLALKSVWMWFNKSAEGQMAFAKISGYVGGVITRLEEIVIELGGIIFNVTKNIVKAISQPKKTFQLVLDFIGDQIKNRLRGFVYSFIDFGKTIANVFSDLWESVKSGKLDFSSTQKSAKKLLDDILAIGTGVNNVTSKIGNAVDATVDWFKETHKVALESKDIAAEERALGLEIESNREKTLKLQKTMAELQATMRNTNLSKAERKKALEEYKKQVEEQAEIQRKFAEKRSSLHQRKLNLDNPDTLEELQEQAALNNAVLAADLGKQRSLTALQRITNSINKKPSGKSKERTNEEYQLLLNENAQKQAKQIRENGYIIEQARINSMREGTERTIAQMKLEYKKELDAAVEYEDELKRQKLKLARSEFYKNPKNKNKTFDLSAVDVSMTEQERQVSASKVSDAQEKYNTQIKSLYNNYETFYDKREKRERDYKALTEFTSQQIIDKTKELGDLYDSLDSLQGKERQKAQERIDILEGEIDKLEEKGRIIKANNELQNEELKAMLDYLKQYGTLAEKKSAIEAEFNQRINAANAEGNIWGAASLEKQKEEAVKSIDLENIKAQIDWEGVFNNLDRYSGEFLEKIRTQLQAVLNDPNIDPDNAKVVSDALSQLDGAIAEKTGNTFRWINEYLLEQKRLQAEAKLAVDAYNIAIGQQTKANLDLAESQKGVEDVVSRISGGKVNLSGKDIKSQSKESIFKMLGIKEVSKEAKELSAAFDKLAKSEQKVSSSTKKVEDAEKKKESAEEKARQKTAEKISGWLNGVNENIQKYLGDLPNLLGSIGLGNLGDKVSKGMSGINDAAGAAADFASGNYIGAAFKGISAIKNIGSALGLSANGNAAEVAETTERLTKKNEDLIRAIESLTGIMDKSYGSKALSVYQQALKAQEDINKNNKEILEAQMGYHASHHSNTYYADDNEIRKYNRAAQDAMRTAGVQVSTITGLQSIYNLTPEQLKAIKDFAPDLWRYLTEVGKYDKSEYWDAVVEQAGKTEELTERIMEKLTTTTEESVFSDFLNQLYALSDGSQEVFSDISKGWQEMVNKMVINNLVGENYQERLKEWRQKIFDLNKEKQENKNGAMTNEVYKKRLQELNAEYQDIVKSAQKDINEYKEAGIIASTDSFNQSATAKSISNISYDQADSLVGIGMAQQMAQEQSRDNLDILNVKAEQLFMTAIESRDIAADSRQILAGMAIHVEEIRDGMVDTVVPAIKEMRTELTKVRKALEEQ